MNTPVVVTIATPEQAQKLDQLLWEVLWKPLAFPRDVRQSFKATGEEIELIAKSGGGVTGGLVAVFLENGEVDLHHLAVRPDAQRQGIIDKHFCCNQRSLSDLCLR